MMNTSVQKSQSFGRHRLAGRPYALPHHDIYEWLSIFDGAVLQLNNANKTVCQPNLQTIVFTEPTLGHIDVFVATRCYCLAL